MGFAQKFKVDKKYRTRTIILFLLVVFLLGNVSDMKKEAASETVCDSYNGFGGYLTSSTGVTQCEAEGCVVLMPQTLYEKAVAGFFDYIPGVSDSANLFKWGLGVESDLARCTYVAPDNALVFASTKGEANSQCSSGSAILYDDKWLGDDVYKCRVGEACGSGFQKQIGSILDSVWESHPFEDCKTKFYVVAGGGGFMLLLLILVAL